MDRKCGGCFYNTIFVPIIFKNSPINVGWTGSPEHDIVMTKLNFYGYPIDNKSSKLYITFRPFTKALFSFHLIMLACLSSSITITSFFCNLGVIAACTMVS